MTPYKSIIVRYADRSILVRCKVKSVESGKQFRKVFVPYSLAVMSGPELSCDGIIDQPFSSAVAVRVAVKRAIRRGEK
jgi:hypothetical protein